MAKCIFVDGVYFNCYVGSIVFCEGKLCAFFLGGDETIEGEAWVIGVGGNCDFGPKIFCFNKGEKLVVWALVVELSLGVLVGDAEGIYRGDAGENFLACVIEALADAFG